MPQTCACGSRLRPDGTCRSASCPHGKSRAAITGQHWAKKRLALVLGSLAGLIGGYCVGGYILCLAHRPDIRVAVASKMALEIHGYNRSLRILVLTVLFLFYWKFTVSPILIHILQSELISAPASDWPRLLQLAVDCGMEAVRGKQVVYPKQVEPGDDPGVRLLPRAEAQKLTDVWRECPFMNPAARRTAEQEWPLLKKDIESGEWIAFCNRISEYWDEHPNDITYTESLAKFPPDLNLFKTNTSARYTKIRLIKYLLKCEELAAVPNPDDVALLFDQGTGVRKGKKESGITDLDSALEACHEIAKQMKIPFAIDDLSTFHCMAMNPQLKGKKYPNLPPVPGPIDISAELVELTGIAAGPSSVAKHSIFAEQCIAAGPGAAAGPSAAGETSIQFWPAIVLVNICACLYDKANFVRSFSQISAIVPAWGDGLRARQVVESLIFKQGNLLSRCHLDLSLKLQVWSWAVRFCRSIPVEHVCEVTSSRYGNDLVVLASIRLAIPLCAPMSSTLAEETVKLMDAEIPNTIQWPLLKAVRKFEGKLAALLGRM